MGTTWSVKVATNPLSKPEQVNLSRALEQSLRKVDRLMSTWRDDSEISQFNRHEKLIPFTISPETFVVFEVAQSVSTRSKGALDITVAPLVDRWGFGPEGPMGISKSSSIDVLNPRIGFENLRLFPKVPAVSKISSEVQCDLSAIAKGFAVDEAARILISQGYENFLVEIGGELRASGAHLNGRTWRVAIEKPLFLDDGFTNRQIHRVLSLRDRAMATSGDYRNYIKKEGRRYSHTIDPSTGQPITHRLASVTVIHEEAVWADAWATALNVLGPEAGYSLAKKENLLAYFIIRKTDLNSKSDDDIEVKFTPRFSSHFLDTGDLKESSK